VVAADNAEPAWLLGGRPVLKIDEAIELSPKAILSKLAPPPIKPNKFNRDPKD
jgi:hypothetical protein